MRHCKPFLLLSILLLLPGCVKVGPNFTRPPVAVSQAWLDAGDQRVKPEPTEYRNWWQIFNDPVLDRLIERAYRENLSLRIAGVRVLEARAQLGIAVGGLFPQTQQAFGSLQYNRTSEGAPNFTSSILSYWQSEIGLQAAWEIDFWGKFRRAVESGNANWLSSIANYDNALVSLTAGAANAYIQIRTLEKRIAIARENVETQKESLKIAEARYQYGTASQLDVDQAKTVLYNTEASIPPLEAQLRQAKDALSVLLGLPPSHLADELAGSSDIPASPTEVIVGIPADLLRRRPDVRSAELQAAAQCAQIGVAKADLYPAFSLTGSFGVLSTNIGKVSLSDMFKWSSRNIQAGPSVQWSILNYGQITNNVRVQDARFQESLMTYQNAVLTAQQEVEDNLIAFLKAQEQAGSLARSATAARGALDLAVQQYREGIVDFTTVLVTQQSLLSVQDNLAATVGNIASNLVGVYKALGGGWEVREGKDLIPSEIREEMAKRTNWGKLLAPASYNPLPPEEPKSLIRLPDW
ncbi:MAG TPA: efflux transporter outer membrane subunit [Thermodesulfobacteriota bacterium]|nr:efflux transporter outer membrane subunit [Thermodesulfobacteriota bacterium]